MKFITSKKEIKSLKIEFEEGDLLYEKCKKELKTAETNYKNWLENLDPSFSNLPQIINDKLINYLKVENIRNNLTTLGFEVQRAENRYKDAIKDRSRNLFHVITTGCMIIISLSSIIITIINV